MLRATRITCLLAAGFTLCGHATAAPAPDIQASNIQVKDAWIRWLPADSPAAGYMTLVNSGTADRVLIAVTSAAYGEVSVHESREDRGISTMRPVDSITLKAQTSVRFAEGGYHLMLMQPRRPVHPGDTVAMTLRFATGPPIEVMFDVRAGG